jgi:hypothetical protein
MAGGWRAQDKLPAAEKELLHAELAEHQTQLDRLFRDGDIAQKQLEHRAVRERVAEVARRVRARVNEL